VQWETL